ncbi:putative porin [Tellurirhabdus bombi]|uniref:putative porin n=1 Tax=Tellurirhabdus bombi TaxID=2907205 RepID=UPI001F300432|nr:putative porin [Tellurirhabdus bombi]
MNRIVWILLILVFIGEHAQAQLPAGLPRLPQGGGGRTGGGGAKGGPVIDDSTKQIYGPKTSRYFLESDVLNNRKNLYLIDTLIEGVHRFSFVQRTDNLLIDLGNQGTALRSIFYQTPEIGAQTGLNAYTPYGYQTQDIRYYDTKSPYTSMYYVAGGRGQNILRFDFTQNITPRWNAGFNIQRFTSDVQFGGATTRSSSNQRLTENWGFVFHTNYRSKNDRYTLLGHYNNLNHRVVEQGGQADTLRYIYDGLSILPPDVNSSEKRNDVHLYHEYALGKGFQLYHVADLKTMRYRFTDDTLRQTLRDREFNFYRIAPGQAISDSSFIEQRMSYRLIENRIGVKGIFYTNLLNRNKESAFSYRLTWFRQRLSRFAGEYNLNRLQTQDYTQTRAENMLSGWLGYYFPDSLSRVTVEADYSLGRDVRLKGQFETKLITAGYESVFASPTFVQDRFESNVMKWNNDFSLRGTQHIYGRINLPLKGFTLQPSMDYFLLNNYIYFDTLARPQQLSSAFSVLRTGVGFQFKAGKFTALGQGYSTLVSRSDVMRIPKLFANLRIEYEFLYAKKLYTQIGIDLHYKSAYFADSYMPLTQQFFLQNRFEVPEALVADVFANARLNRVRLFVKLSHANQGWPNDGYYTAPYYLGMRRALSFGVHWLLFD